MLNKFIELYNLPKGSIFKRTELEDALIEEYNCLHYSKFDSWTEKDTGFEHPVLYTANVKEEWGNYELSSELCLSPEDALLNLFVKYGKEKTEDEFDDMDDYYNYMDNFDQSRKLKRIIGEVYGTIS